jgi:long-subunit acyl-CoA synthetase (AMP-forming)
MADETHNFLSLVKSSLVAHTDECAFRPYRDGSWGAVSFAEHHQHVAFAARHFQALLSEVGVRPGDVVGIWYHNSRMPGLVLIFITQGNWCPVRRHCSDHGVDRGGCGPTGPSQVSFLFFNIRTHIDQLFSVVFTPQIILTMLKKSGAKALVADRQFVADAGSSGVPVFTTLTSTDLEGAHGVYLGDIPKVQASDHAIIVHSSGTTSGMPKLIFQSHAWLQTLIKHKWGAVMNHPDHSTPTVTNTLGSLAHVGSFCGILFY